MLLSVVMLASPQVWTFVALLSLTLGVVCQTPKDASTQPLLEVSSSIIPSLSVPSSIGSQSEHVSSTSTVVSSEMQLLPRTTRLTSIEPSLAMATANLHKSTLSTVKTVSEITKANVETQTRLISSSTLIYSSQTAKISSLYIESTESTASVILSDTFPTTTTTSSNLVTDSSVINSESSEFFVTLMQSTSSGSMANFNPTPTFSSTDISTVYAQSTIVESGLIATSSVSNSGTSGLFSSYMPSISSIQTSLNPSTSFPTGVSNSASNTNIISEFTDSSVSSIAFFFQTVNSFISPSPTSETTDIVLLSNALLSTSYMSSSLFLSKETVVLHNSSISSEVTPVGTAGVELSNSLTLQNIASFSKVTDSRSSEFPMSYISLTISEVIHSESLFSKVMDTVSTFYSSTYSSKLFLTVSTIVSESIFNTTATPTLRSSDIKTSETSTITFSDDNKAPSSFVSNLFTSELTHSSSLSQSFLNSPSIQSSSTEKFASVSEKVSGSSSYVTTFTLSRHEHSDSLMLTSSSATRLESSFVWANTVNMESEMSLLLFRPNTNIITATSEYSSIHVVSASLTSYPSSASLMSSINLSPSGSLSSLYDSRSGAFQTQSFTASKTDIVSSTELESIVTKTSIQRDSTYISYTMVTYAANTQIAPTEQSSFSTHQLSSGIQSLNSLTSLLSVTPSTSDQSSSILNSNDNLFTTLFNSKSAFLSTSTILPTRTFAFSTSIEEEVHHSSSSSGSIFDSYHFLSTFDSQTDRIKPSNINTLYSSVDMDNSTLAPTKVLSISSSVIDGTISFNSTSGKSNIVATESTKSLVSQTLSKTDDIFSISETFTKTFTHAISVSATPSSDTSLLTDTKSTPTDVSSDSVLLSLSTKTSLFQTLSATSLTPSDRFDSLLTKSEFSSTPKSIQLSTSFSLHISDISISDLSQNELNVTSMSSTPIESMSDVLVNSSSPDLQMGSTILSSTELSLFTSTVDETKYFTPLSSLASKDSSQFVSFKTSHDSLLTHIMSMYTSEILPSYTITTGVKSEITSHFKSFSSLALSTITPSGLSSLTTITSSSVKTSLSNSSHTSLSFSDSQLSISSLSALETSKIPTSSLTIRDSSFLQSSLQSPLISQSFYSLLSEVTVSETSLKSLSLLSSVKRTPSQTPNTSLMESSFSYYFETPLSIDNLSTSLYVVSSTVDISAPSTLTSSIPPRSSVVDSQTPQLKSISSTVSPLISASLSSSKILSSSILSASSAIISPFSTFSSITHSTSLQNFNSSSNLITTLFPDSRSLIITLPSLSSTFSLSTFASIPSSLSMLTTLPVSSSIAPTSSLSVTFSINETTLLLSSYIDSSSHLSISINKSIMATLPTSSASFSSQTSPSSALSSSVHKTSTFISSTTLSISDSLTTDVSLTPSTPSLSPESSFGTTSQTAHVSFTTTMATASYISSSVYVMRSSVSTTLNVYMTSTLASTTSSVTVSITPTPTVEPPRPTTANATTVTETFWVKTVLKIQPSTDISKDEFKADLELRLATAYNEAFIREKLIADGKFEPLKRRRRKKRYTTVGDATVHIRDITRESGTSTVSASYAVERSGTILTADDAVKTMSVLDKQELAIILRQVIDNMAEPYIQTEPKELGPTDSSQLLLIGMIAGPIAGVLTLLWIVLCIYFKYCRKSPDDCNDDAEPQLTSLDIPVNKGSIKKSSKHFDLKLPIQNGVSDGNTPATSFTDKTKRLPRQSSKVSLKKSRAYEINPPFTNVAMMSDDKKLVETPARNGKRETSASSRNKQSASSSPARETLSPPKHKHKRGRRNSIEPLTQADVYTDTSNKQLSHTATNQGPQSSISDDNEELKERAKIERRKNKERLREKRRLEAGTLNDGFIASQNDINALLGMPITSLPSVFIDSGSPVKKGTTSRRDSGIYNDPQSTSGNLSGDENLDAARSRMHKLLDEAFSLISPRSSFSEGDIRQDNQIAKKDTKTLLEDSERVLDTVQKQHPMFVVPAVSSYNDFPLETWSPYRGKDTATLISMPNNTEPTKLGGKKDNKLPSLSTSKMSKRPAANFDFPESKSVSQMDESKYTTNPPKPVVLRTKDINSANKAADSSTNFSRSISNSGLNRDLLSGSATSFSKPKSKSNQNPNNIELHDVKNIKNGTKKPKRETSSKEIDIVNDLKLDPNSDNFFQSFRDELQVLKGQYQTEKPAKSRRSKSKMMTDIV